MELIEVDAVTAKLDELLALAARQSEAGMKDILVPISPRRAARQDHHPAHQGGAHERRHQGRQRQTRAGAARENLEGLGRRRGEPRHRRSRISPRVNEKLWVIEDEIRDEERAKRFADKFIELARAVYFTNDERAAIKKRINTLLGSTIVEEKSYKQY